MKTAITGAISTVTLSDAQSLRRREMLYYVQVT